MPPSNLFPILYRTSIMSLGEGADIELPIPLAVQLHSSATLESRQLYITRQVTLPSPAGLLFRLKPGWTHTCQQALSARVVSTGSSFSSAAEGSPQHQAPDPLSLELLSVPVSDRPWQRFMSTKAKKQKKRSGDTGSEDLGDPRAGSPLLSRALSLDPCGVWLHR